MAFGQAFKVTGVDHSTPEQILQAEERSQRSERSLPPKPRKTKKAQIEIPLPTDTVNIQ
jgi:hypothetical protein